MSILQGLRVLEISGTGAAGWATKHFADWGADVTILEPAGGTPLRGAPPYYERGGQRQSALWQWLSRGKTAVRVGDDLPTTPADARALCERADVVVAESGLVEAVLGLRPAEVRPEFEGKTVFTLISPFATDGPYASYRATDLGINALGGWVGILGEPDREPLRPGGDMNYRVTGIYTFQATLAALRHRRLGAAPSFIDVSQQAVAAGVLTAPWLFYSLLGAPMQRRKATWPQTVVQCKDGWVGISPLTAAHWELLCQMLGIADVLEEPGGREPAYRETHGNELLERVRPWFESRTRQEIYTEAQAWRLPSAPVDTVEQRLEDPQLTARGFFLESEVDGRQVKTPRVPYLLRDAKPVERGPVREAPSTTIEASPQPSGTAPALPFEGIRVMDMTWFWSGPHCAMTLGALGADVIKLEAAQRPDSYRYTSVDPTQERWYERGALWNDTNQDKRGLTLDLNHPTGMQLFEQLLQQSDVVISNFSNRVLPNLGLTVERFHEINPRLIVVLMPGYGPDGPWGEFVGYGVSFEQAVVATSTGYPDRRPTINGGFSDPLVGTHTLAAIELALIERERTGKGTYVEVPQCETLDSLMAPEHIAVQHGAPSPVRRANQHEWMAPHNVYQVAGDDEWISIAVATDEEFAALAKAISRPELASDERFASIEARKAYEAALDGEIAAAVRQCDLKNLERDLQVSGVMGCRVTKPYQLTQDEGLKHLDFFQTMTREVTGTHPVKTYPYRFSGFPARHRRPAPLLGEHNHEILSTLLGLSDAEIAALEEERVIGTVPIGFKG